MNRSPIHNTRHTQSSAVEKSCTTRLLSIPSETSLLPSVHTLPNHKYISHTQHTTRATLVVCAECLPADKPWDVVSATRRSSGVAPRACVRVYARVLVPPNLYMHAYIYTLSPRRLPLPLSKSRAPRDCCPYRPRLASSRRWTHFPTINRISHTFICGRAIHEGDCTHLVFNCVYIPTCNKRKRLTRVLEQH